MNKMYMNPFEEKMKKEDVGNKCVDCMRDTSFGSGLFVNRIPANLDIQDCYGNTIERDGYMCAECQGDENDINIGRTLEYVLSTDSDEDLILKTKDIKFLKIGSI